MGTLNKRDGAHGTHNLRRKLRRKRAKEMSKNIACYGKRTKALKNTKRASKAFSSEHISTAINEIKPKKKSVKNPSNTSGHPNDSYQDRLTRDYESFKQQERKYLEHTNVSRKKSITYANKRDDEEIAELSGLLRLRDANKTSKAFLMDGLGDLLDICRDPDEIEDIGTAWIENDEMNESAMITSPVESVVSSRTKIKKSKSPKKVTFANEPELLEPKPKSKKKVTFASEVLEPSVLQTEAVLAKKNPSTEMVENKELIRRLRALFNRLSCGNLSWALKEYQEIHNSSGFSRHELKHHLWLSLEHSVLKAGTNVPDNMLLEHAGFMALINADVDEQWGPFLLNRLIHCNNQLNAARVAAALASLKVIQTQILADIVNNIVGQKILSLDDLAEMCFSAHRLFPLLRKNDSFRSTVQSLISSSDLSIRAKVLLEQCLKKNKESDYSSIIKVVQNISVRPLTAATITSSFNELKSGHFNVHSGQCIIERQDNPRDRVIEPVAKKLRMNTGVRSTILQAVLQSEDYLDATSRLLQLKLAKLQRREIINVLMVMMLKEKTFNEFYPLLIDKLCKANKLFVQTTKQRTWEKFKEPPKRPTIFSDFVVHLLKSQTFNLSILKAVPFATMDTILMHMVRNIVLKFFDQADEQLVINQILMIVKDTRLNELCKSLRLFIEKFINSGRFIELNSANVEKTTSLAHKTITLLRSVEC